jgi:hypothetical protein
MMTNDTSHATKEVNATAALADRALDEISFTLEPEAEAPEKHELPRIGRASVCTASILLRCLAKWCRTKLDRIRPLMPLCWLTLNVNAAGFGFRWCGCTRPLSAAGERYCLRRS